MFGKLNIQKIYFFCFSRQGFSVVFGAFSGTGSCKLGWPLIHRDSPASLYLPSAGIIGVCYPIQLKVHLMLFNDFHQAYSYVILTVPLSLYIKLKPWCGFWQ